MKKKFVNTLGVLIFNIVLTTTENCQDGKFGKECLLQCMCRNPTVNCKGNCNQCATRYSPLPKCQRENIAFNKTVRGSGEQAQCRRMVDGNTRASAERCMLFPGSQSEQWIAVDLKYHYDIKWMKLYIRGNYQGGTSVHLSKEILSFADIRPILESSQLCWKSSDRTPPRQGAVNNEYEWEISCKLFTLARYVLLQKTADYAIREIEVYYCTPYTYGRECVEQCNCYHRTDECHKVTGSCPRGCAIGYTGKGCKEKCTNNTYGVDCKYKCNCARDATCDHHEGYCPGGRCNVRHISHNNRCQRTCPRGKFHYPVCNGTCGCLDSDRCDVINGDCHDSACATVRYTGRYCNKSKLILIVN